MRIEYNFPLDRVDLPAFSVEATEGANKLFTLSTLVLNVLGASRKVSLVFHSPNPDEPPRKIALFQQILANSPNKPDLEYEDGESGSLGGVYFRWLSIRSSGGRASDSRG